MLLIFKTDSQLPFAFTTTLFPPTSTAKGSAFFHPRALSCPAMVGFVEIAGKCPLKVLAKFIAEIFGDLAGSVILLDVQYLYCL